MASLSVTLKQLYVPIAANYEDMLSSETNQLEEFNREINNQIDRIKQRLELTAQRRDKLEHQMEPHIQILNNHTD